MDWSPLLQNVHNKTTVRDCDEKQPKRALSNTRRGNRTSETNPMVEHFSVYCAAHSDLVDCRADYEAAIDSFLLRLRND